jgi:hypothetical protein
MESEKNRVVWLFSYAIFAFGFLIAFVLPENLLAHIGSSSIIPSVIKYAQCSSMPVRVTAFFNFMWAYLIVPVVAIGFFHSYKPKNQQQRNFLAMALMLCAILTIAAVIYMGFLSEPSCVNGYTYLTDRKIDDMVTNKFSLWLMGGMLMAGLSLAMGMFVLFIKTLIIRK